MITNNDLVSRESFDDALILNVNECQKQTYNYYNVKKYGDTITTSTIKQAINDCHNNGGGVVYIPKVDYEIHITEYINFPSNVGFDGGNNILRPKVENGFCFGTNSKNCNTWDIPWSGSEKGMNRYPFGNFTMVNTDIYDKNNNLIERYTAGAKGIYMCDAHEMQNMYFDCMFQSIYTIRKYIDNKHFKNILCNYGKGNLYQMDIYQGDSLIVDSCNGASDYFLKLGYIQGGTVQNCIGGKNFYVEYSDALKFTGCHNELGDITIVNSNVSIEDSFWFAFPNKSNIKIKPSQYAGHSTVHLKNLVFCYMIDRYTYDGTEVQLEDLSGKSIIYVDNIKSCIEYGGVHGNRYYFSAKTNLSDFNKNGAINSIHSIINSGKVNTVDIDRCPTTWTNYFISGLSEKTPQLDTLKWKGDLGTYYYTAQVIYDEDRRLGYNSHDSYERSCDITSNDKAILVTPGNIEFAPFKLRIFRGNSPSSYNKYCDVDLTLVGGEMPLDNYESIGGVHRWKQNVDNSLNPCTKYKRSGDNVIVWCSSTPSSGAWKQGDIIYNNTPTNGNPFGWVCTQSGSPGIWRNIGNLS